LGGELVCWILQIFNHSGEHLGFILSIFPSGLLFC
jgi:hypothetical protein